MKVGDYVRTKDGDIFQITGSDIEFASEIGSDGNLPFNAKIISSEIIDLIEENDLIKYRINGDLYVSEVEGVPIFDKYKLSISYADTIIFLEELDIVSVVTREQFESMEYRIGE